MEFFFISINPDSICSDIFSLSFFILNGSWESLPSTEISPSIMICPFLRVETMGAWFSSTWNEPSEPGKITELVLPDNNLELIENEMASSKKVYNKLLKKVDFSNLNLKSYDEFVNE